MTKKKRIPLVILALSVFFLIFTIYNTYYPDPLREVRRVVVEASAYVRALLRAPLDEASDAWKRYVFLVGVVDENRRLRREADRLTGQIAAYREAYEENIRLKRLLDLKELEGRRPVVARVIGVERKYVMKTIMINRGTADGVYLGAPVVTDRGLVGRIVETSWHTARVLLVIDETSNIDAVTQTNRVQGIVQGTGTGCVMKYVGKMEEVNQGDALVTSGISQTFPKGLLIGYVQGADRLEGGMFQKIGVVPAVMFSRLEEVVVLLAPRKGKE